MMLQVRQPHAAAVNYWSNPMSRLPSDSVSPPHAGEPDLRFGTRTLFLVASVVSIMMAIVGPFLRKAAESSPEQVAYFAGGAVLAVVAQIWRSREQLHELRRVAATRIMIPKRSCVSRPARVARCMIYTALTSLLAGPMVLADKQPVATIFAGGLLVTWVWMKVSDLLFNPQYNQATLFDSHLRVGTGEDLVWGELVACWGRIEGDLQHLDILAPTPRTYREINLVVPAPLISEVHQFVSPRVREQRGVPALQLRAEAN